MAKSLVLGPILVHLARIRAANFFFEIFPPSVTRYYSQLWYSTILEKTNDPILGKLSDGRTDRGTDHESDFIGRCPTKVERPIKQVLDNQQKWNMTQIPTSKKSPICFKTSHHQRFECSKHIEQAHLPVFQLRIF